MIRVAVVLNKARERTGGRMGGLECDHGTPYTYLDLAMKGLGTVGLPAYPIWSSSFMSSCWGLDYITCVLGGARLRCGRR